MSRQRGSGEELALQDAGALEADEEDVMALPREAMEEGGDDADDVDEGEADGAGGVLDEVSGAPPCACVSACVGAVGGGWAECPRLRGRVAVESGPLASWHPWAVVVIPRTKGWCGAAARPVMNAREGSLRCDATWLGRDRLATRRSLTTRTSPRTLTRALVILILLWWLRARVPRDEFTMCVLRSHRAIVRVGGFADPNEEGYIGSARSRLIGLIPISAAAAPPRSACHDDCAHHSRCCWCNARAFCGHPPAYRSPPTRCDRRPSARVADADAELLRTAGLVA